MTDQAPAAEPAAQRGHRIEHQRIERARDAVQRAIADRRAPAAADLDTAIGACGRPSCCPIDEALALLAAGQDADPTAPADDDARDLPGETWQQITGWPYERSNRGRVRSLDRFVCASGGRRFWRGRILKIQHPSGGPTDGGGGPRVTLSDGNRRATYYLRTGRISAWVLTPPQKLASPECRPAAEQARQPAIQFAAPGVPALAATESRSNARELPA